MEPADGGDEEGTPWPSGSEAQPQAAAFTDQVLPGRAEQARPFWSPSAGGAGEGGIAIRAGSSQAQGPACR